MSFRSKEVRRHVREVFAQSAPPPLGQMPYRLHVITQAHIQGVHTVSKCPVASSCDLESSCDGDICLYNELFSGREPN